MVLLVALLPLIAVAMLFSLPGGTLRRRCRGTRSQITHAVRYRTKRVRLPHDWWEQFERDFSAYADPLAVRAREEEERLG